MKSVPQALNIRSLVLENFEEALLESNLEKRLALMNFVIVGGGPTGVETAGAISELKKHVIPNDYPEMDLSKVNIYLVENSPELLGQMSQQAQEKAKEFISEEEVELEMKK